MMSSTKHYTASDDSKHILWEWYVEKQSFSVSFSDTEMQKSGENFTWKVRKWKEIKAAEPATIILEIRQLQTKV